MEGTAEDREQARELVRRLVAAYNAKDLEGILSSYAPQARYWSTLGGWQSGREALREHVTHLFTTLPDETMEILTLVTDGETAVAQFASTGTSGSGDPYRIEFAEVYEIRDGRILETRVYVDPEDVAAIAT